MKAPVSNASSTPGAAGTALATTNTGDSIIVTSGVTSVSKSNVMTLTITAASNGSNLADVYILYKTSVPEASRTLQSNTTYTGDFSTWAAFQAYVSRIPLRITKIEMWTDDTSNYSGRLILSQIKPNNTTDDQYIELPHYRKSNGNGYSDYLVIDDVEIFTGGMNYLRLSALTDDSYIKMILTVEGLGIVHQFVKVGF